MLWRLLTGFAFVYAMGSTADERRMTARSVQRRCASARDSCLSNQQTFAPHWLPSLPDEDLSSHLPPGLKLKPRDSTLTPLLDGNLRHQLMTANTLKRVYRLDPGKLHILPRISRDED